MCKKMSRKVLRNKDLLKREELILKCEDDNKYCKFETQKKQR